MKNAKTILMTSAMFCLSLAMCAFGAPKEKALIVGTPNYCHIYSTWLQNDFVCSRIDKDNGEKVWKNKGYILPKYDKLKEYKLVVICPCINTLPVNKNDIIEYVKNGGNIYYGYNSLEGTFMRSKELGYGICGFDKLTPVHLRPYPKAGSMTHNLVYTKEMGKERSFQKKILYSVYASDLIDAVPLVVNADKKGMALACVAKYGKGQFIYFGGEDHQIFMDIMKKCGLSR